MASPVHGPFGRDKDDRTATSYENAPKFVPTAAAIVVTTDSDVSIPAATAHFIVVIEVQDVVAQAVKPMTIDGV